MSFEHGSATHEPRVVVLGAGEGHRIDMGQTSDHMLLKAAGEDSAGYVSLLEYHAEPGSEGVPLHMHDGHEEGFYILEGQLEMQLDDEVAQFSAGSFVFVPRGVAHRFANPSDEPCVFLATFSPAGFEHFFEERARFVAEHGDDQDALVAFARSHGVIYLDDAAQARRRV